MTPPDQDLPPDDGPDDIDDDELAVNAVLDDEADAEQRRRVARDPILVARVAELRSVAASVGAPVPSPDDEIFAAMRDRAITAALAPETAATTTPAQDAVAADDAGGPVTPGPRPTAPRDDLAERRSGRARRRQLPPLPAVAAVVILLVLVGAGLILTDRGGDDADTAAVEMSDDAGGSGDDASQAPANQGEGTTAAGDEAAAADASGRAQADATYLAQASVAYADQEELLDALRTIDPETLDLTGTGEPVTAPSTTAADPDDGVEESGDAPSTTTASTTLSIRDPAVTRCDTVLRASAPNIGPAQAAAMVVVDGLPVLVLSNPIEATADEEANTRLSTFDAVSCVPGDAVQR